MKINKLLTPYNYKEGTIDRIQYIVIHYVGATGGAEANCKYYAEKYRGASAHYFVGHAGEVWQCVEDQNIAWHCGGKKYANTDGGTYHEICTNANSIGIEMCVRKDSNGKWYFEDVTVKVAIELTTYLMKKYNISADNVIRHYDVTGKNCPDPYVGNKGKHTWDEFKAAIKDVQKDPGWIKCGDRWKYLKSNGEYMKNDWMLINHHWYMFDQEGWMLIGWQQKGGKWFYLEEAGDYAGACWHESAERDGSMERWFVQ